jgi:protein-tyrosine phosphatase
MTGTGQEGASGSVLRVDWIDERHTTPGRLGLTTMPGRPDLDRDLGEDLEALARDGITHVACLVEDRELGHYGVPDLLEGYRAAGLEVRRLPIADMGVPSHEQMAGLVAWMGERLAEGRRVLVHCVGGLGRSGTAAACYLRHRGLGTEEAIGEVRRARSPMAVENARQEEFVRSYEPPAGRLSGRTPS